MSSTAEPANSISRPIHPPTLDERLRDLEALHTESAKKIAEAHTRLEKVEDWPRRIVVAVVGGALGMMATVGGSAWYLGSRLTATEVAVDGVSTRVERMDTRLDRIEDRAWQRRPPRDEE